MKTTALFITLLTTGVVAAISACSSDDDSNAGAAGAAGASGGAAGSGGAVTGGSGGATGGNGGATGGSGGATPSCAAPTDGAALCLSFDPEAMTFDAADPRLDGRGILFVQIYDTPTVDGVDGGPQATPLHEQVIPDQGDAGVGEVSIDQLPSVRVEGLPETVYIRSFFADNLDVLGGNLTWGVWVGGFDLSGGLVQNAPLTAVSLTTGQGTAVTQQLVALRKLSLSISLAAGVTPEDDAVGPASAIVVDTNAPGPGSAGFGFAGAPCADVSTGAATLEGLVVGSGDYYVTAVLDDFNLGGDLPEGSLYAFDIGDAGAPVIPEANKVTIGATEYSVSHSIELNGVVPVNAPPGPRPASYTCTP